MVQLRREVNFETYDWTEHKMHVILQNCSTFREAMLKKNFGRLDELSVLTILAEAKREIGFNLKIPQLLIEDVSLRNFLIDSGKIEAHRLKIMKIPNIKLTDAPEDDIYDIEFKAVFEIFDFISDESIMADLFAPWSKSFVEDKNEIFEAEYKKFRSDLNSSNNLNTESISTRFRTSTRNCQQLSYNCDSLKILRKDAVKNFHEDGFYCKKGDMSINFLDLDDSHLAVKIQRESSEIRRVKKNFEFLNLEIQAMSKEIKSYTQYISEKSVIPGINLNIITRNIENSQKRRSMLISIDQKLKLAKYDCMTKVEKMRANFLNNDVAEVRNLIFKVGNTLNEKMSEIKSYFSDNASIANAINDSDFSKPEKMITEYGVKLRQYFLRMNEQIAFKVQISIKEILSEFEGHQENICKLDEISDNENLTEVELAIKHLSIIGVEPVSMRILSGVPSWDEISNLNIPIPGINNDNFVTMSDKSPNESDLSQKIILKEIQNILNKTSHNLEHSDNLVNTLKLKPSVGIIDQLVPASNQLIVSFDLPPLSPLITSSRKSLDPENSIFEIDYVKYQNKYKKEKAIGDDVTDKKCMIFSAGNLNVNKLGNKRSDVSSKYIPIKPSSKLDFKPRSNRKRKYDLSDSEDEKK